MINSGSMVSAYSLDLQESIPLNRRVDDSRQIKGLLSGSHLFSINTYLKASNTETWDYFGYSVAISGNTAVIGAPNEDSNAVDGQTNNSAQDSGAAYVFIREGQVWVQQAFLKASNAEANDRFGWSVAISGDTILVGAFGEDSNGVAGDPANNDYESAGAAYVFTRNGNEWSQSAYLKASHPGVKDYFGSAVAISGDTIVIGAYAEDSNATGVNGDDTNDLVGCSGAAYIFVRSGGAWTQQAYLKASNTGEEDDSFGYSVAVSNNTVVIGAYMEDSNAITVDGDQSNNSAYNSGAVYVFTQSGSVWSQQAYIKSSNSEAEDLFGYAVAISGDLLAVGAIWEDSNATGSDGDQSNNSALSSGAVYVFSRSGSVWTQQAYLKASNTNADDSFGESVSISGNRLLVCAYTEDSNAIGINSDEEVNSAESSGAAYAFLLNGSEWSQQAYLKASNTETYDYYGYSVAISGDTMLIGAFREDSNSVGVNGDQENNSSTYSGAAYIAKIPLNIVFIPLLIK